MITARKILFILWIMLGIALAMAALTTDCCGQDTFEGPIRDAFERRLAKQQTEALQKQEQAFGGFLDRFREEQSKRD